MNRTGLAAAVAVVVMAWSGLASAHELECEKTVNGHRYLEVDSYPIDLDYELVVRNIHPSLPSDVLGLEDSLLEDLDADWFVPPGAFEFDPAAPFTLGLGEEETYEATVHVGSYEECLDLAGMDGEEDEFIENVFTVTWDSGQDHCKAKVKCERPPPPPPPGEVECKKEMTLRDQTTGDDIVGNVIPFDTAVYIDFLLAIRNTGGETVSITDLSDPLLELLPATVFTSGEKFDFDGVTLPFNLPPSMTWTEWEATVMLDENQCTRLDNLDGADDNVITNTFTVTWDGHTETCTDKLYCEAPPPVCMNRTLGYWKTHPLALQACLDEAGTFNWGEPNFSDAFDPISTIEDAMALLWANPSEFSNEIDRDRFLLARQLLVAICNTEVFDSTRIDEIDDAIAALNTNDCDEIHRLAGFLDRWNNSCEDGAEPNPYGRADPDTAMDLAENGDNPVNETNDVCAEPAPGISAN